MKQLVLVRTQVLRLKIVKINQGQRLKKMFLSVLKSMQKMPLTLLQ